jgi:hypothetical protein
VVACIPETEFSGRLIALLSILTDALHTEVATAMINSAIDYFDLQSEKRPHDPQQDAVDGTQNGRPFYIFYSRRELARSRSLEFKRAASL